MRTFCSGKGLPCGDCSAGCGSRGAAGALRARGGSASTASVCSPSVGALRPTCQLVAVDSHLLVQ